MPARILGSPLGKVVDKINNFTTGDTFTEITTSNLNKLWRAKILLDRSTRFGEKLDASYITPEDKKALYNKDFSFHPLDRDFTEKEGQHFYAYRKSASTKENYQFRQTQEADSGVKVQFSHNDSFGGPDSIGINKDSWLNWYNPDKTVHQSQAYKARIYIINYNTSPYQYLTLQTIPKEIEVQTESTWAVINSMGRNVPMYHYTGSEQTINLDISWYCNDPSNPAEVLEECRLLEAWSKANGYAAAPPVLEIKWGDSDIFKGQKFILQSANYKLNNWKSLVKVKDYKAKNWINPKNYPSNYPSLMPSMATQELIFKRVSATNPTYADYYNMDNLQKTGGRSYGFNTTKKPL